MRGKAIILIVDDSTENVHILLNIFKDEFKVFIAMNGVDALRMVHEVTPDIILLDIVMPRMDGYEVLTKLKEDESTANIPVLFITALTDTKDEQKGLEMGAEDYIIKPFQSALVKLRVKKHLELNTYRKHLSDVIAEKTAELEKVNRSKHLLQSVMIESLGTLAEYRDPETGGHIKRTQSYVKALARHLKNKGKFKDILTEDYINLLYMSAPLHDVGKVGVHDSILQKHGSLTDSEFEEIQRHTIYGYNTLHKSEIKLGKNSFISLSMKIAHTHHEKWDGTGYPRGLKGDKIPLSGRLMALADVYDALISKRVYKPPFSHEKACDIIINGDGRTLPSHFDPDVLQAFIEIESVFRNIALTFADFEEEREALGASREWSDMTKISIHSILVVEDHEINMAIMKAQLNELGYRVDTAKNGADALELLKNEDFDLVLTDLDMPVMDGYVLLKTLRDAGNMIPVMAITSNDYDMNNARAQELGFNGYLLKPIEEDVFQSKVYQISNFGDTQYFDDLSKNSDSERVVNFSFISELTSSRAEAKIFFQEYLESNKADYLRLSLAVELKDAESIRRAAHRLKSSANMFGADKLSAVCGSIEMDAINAKLDNLQKLLATTKERIEEIQKYVEDRYV